MTNDKNLHIILWWSICCNYNFLTADVELIFVAYIFLIGELWKIFVVLRHCHNQTMWNTIALTNYDSRIGKKVGEWEKKNVIQDKVRQKSIL